MMFMQSERRNMKKLLRRAALTAFVFGCMTCAAFAMDADVIVVDSGTSLTPAGGQAITNAVPKTTVSDPTSYTLSYSDTSVKAGEQYLVLMVAVNDVTSDKPNYAITSDSLVYINQAASTAGNVAFSTVYPSCVTDSVILLTGGSLTEPKLLAKVDAQGILGDVNYDNKVTVGDASDVLGNIVGKVNFDATQTAMADVNHDGKITVGDASDILGYIVGKVTFE